MDSLSSLSGTRKAAILMVLLGDDVSAKLFRHLPRHQVVGVVKEVADLDVIEPELARAVLEEYFVNAVRPVKDRGGHEVARRLLARSELSGELDDVVPDDSEPDLFAPFLEAPANVLASALSAEHPQTTALVLLNLPPAKAARTLQALPEELRADTVLRMSSLRQVPGDLVGEIASSLREKLGDPALEPEEDAAADGLERTASVLQSLSRSAARVLLEQLEQEDPERAARLRDMVYTFDTLALADSRGLQELLRLVDGKTLALALHDAGSEISDKFLGNLSERAAGMLREEMEYLSNVRPADREAAQRQILDKALELESQEKLFFEEPEEHEGSSDD